MDEFERLLIDTGFSTEESVKLIKNGNREFVSSVYDAYMLEKEKLIHKYKDSNLSKTDMLKKELTEYMQKIIECINQEYGDIIPKEKLDVLNRMNDDGIVIINDESDKHDMSANSNTGHVIANLAALGKTSQRPNPDIYTQMTIAKGSLPHEMFHVIIQMLKPDELADERMVIKTTNGKEITSRGMVGFMLNEGFVEKFSSDLCKKYNLYYQIAPQYIPYVNICDYIMKEHLSINSQFVFSSDEEKILDNLNEQERNLYHKYELISYAVRHEDIKRDEIVDYHIEKVDLSNDYNNKQELNKMFDKDVELNKHNLDNNKQL